MLLVVASRADCPKAVLRASRFRDSRHEPQAVRRVRRLTACPKAFAVVAQPEGCCRPHALGAAGCAAAEAMSAVVRRSETRFRKRSHSTCLPKKAGLSRAKDRWPSRTRSLYLANEIRANTKFTQPEVWPTPAGRTGLNSLTNRRDNRQHTYAGARVAAQVCCDPVVIGPRTSQSVRLAARRGKPACLIPSGRSRRGA